MAAQPKQKPLLPVLKEKKRYLAYKVHADKALPARTGHFFIAELQRLLGVFDAAQAGLLYIDYNMTTQTGVFKVSNQSTNKVRQAMLLVQQLNNQPVMIQPILASGILRKAKQAM